MELVPIHELMKSYVNEKGLCQKLIAENMDTTESKVSLMLNGKRRMTVDDYIALCKAMAVPPTKFISERR